uniref:OSJNBb0046K02.2 protein n=1 Tax=Oryza sativa subsp. japonica TaxID=39947 RepID=Q7DNC1_ORYSJ|nr:OSJNBb0046K02.2 [Oryza sativa Japonica Group]
MDEVWGHLSTINRILESHDLHLPHIKKHGSGSGTGEESFVPNQDQSTSGSGVLRNNELEFLDFDITYTSTKRRANHAGHTSQKGCATFSLRTNSHRSSSLVLVIP